MVQVIFVMGLTAMGFYFLSAYFVSYVQTTGHLSREQSLLVNAAALALYAVLLPLGGRLGDRFGRKPMLIAGSAALALLSVPSFMLVTSGSLPLALLGQSLFVVALCIYGGGCYTFFVEIFTTRTRFTSAAISYNGAYALFGGTAPFIGTALVGGTGVPHAPGFYMAAAAAVVLLLVLFTKVPETRGRMG
jgi:MHS family proline/betaine transporter-like MFS transporter